MLSFRINGQECAVWENDACFYTVRSFDASVAQIIFPGIRPEDVTVRPLSRRLSCTDDGGGARLDVPIPGKLCLEITGIQKPLFVFLYPAEDIPAPSEHIRVLQPGDYDAATTTLSSGDTLYLCEGARLHGRIRAENAENITVCGRGVVDVGDYPERGKRVLLFRNVRGITLRDISVVGSCGWSVHLNGCADAVVDSVNLISWKVCGDGVDIVGSHDVSVTDVFARTADDCVALKATDYNGAEGLQDVYNVAVRRCIFWNARPGNGIEIGFETRCEEIRDVCFEDIDLLRCEYEGWQSGGAITIHNGDRARIHDIVYRNIRIERAEEKLFDFKVLNSRYSRDEKRGVVENILIENLDVTGGELPPSILQGHTDAGCEVRGVTFRNIRYRGTLLKDRLALRLIAERTKDIRFERGEEV